jgi:hypothetical protein
LIAGLLAASEDLCVAACSALEQRYGAIDAASVPQRWTVTSYYADEMGDDILRQFVSFATLIDPDRIAPIKIETNTLEDMWRKEGKRAVNLDPGYVGLAKLVLATTKDAAQRIYLSGGIYAEPTLRYEGGSFRPYAYTYNDYADSAGLAFFNSVRARYVEQLRIRS